MIEIDRRGDVLLTVHVQPGAKRPGVAGRHGDALKLRVTAPPTGGRANAAVIALVAELLAVPPATVTLVSGAASRRKRLRISPTPPTPATTAALAARLESLAAGA
jgi:uncharacterized protein (TIGR00251 family)